mgnify:CR=1 FL=1
MATIDVTYGVRTAAEEVIHQGGVVLAISIDINAFRSLRGCKIKKALIRHQVPYYLEKVVKEIRVPLARDTISLRLEGRLPAGELAAEFY